MDFTSIILLILTFVVAVLQSISDKPVERRGGLKRLNLPNVLIATLSIALIISIIETYNKGQKELTQEVLTNETHDNAENTKKKLEEVDTSINILMIDLKKQMEFAKLNLEGIKSLNNQVAKSIIEYQRLNTQYSYQLKIEREKLLNAHPDVKIFRPVTTQDSTTYNYQFQLVNLGNRIADSVFFISTILLLDRQNKEISYISPLKTNLNENNILDLPANDGMRRFANSYVCSKEEAKMFGAVYLIVKFGFYDAMTDTHTVSPVTVFKSQSLNLVEIQYGTNVEASVTERIKAYLKTERKNFYEIFFERDIFSKSDKSLYE